MLFFFFILAPPFNESVNWIIFKEPMEVSSEQLNLVIDVFFSYALLNITKYIYFSSESFEFTM